MKKNIVILTVAIVCMALASPGFAESTFTGKIGTVDVRTTVIGGATFVPSTGVYVSVASDTNAYCVTSVHTSSAGSDAGKVYGSSSADATIFSMSAESVETDPNAGTFSLACTSTTAIPTGSWQ